MSQGLEALPQSHVEVSEFWGNCLKIACMATTDNLQVKPVISMHTRLVQDAKAGVSLTSGLK